MNPNAFPARRRARAGFALLPRVPCGNLDRRAGTRPLRGRAGFTLIELLVAIAILGILGTVVIRTVWRNVDEAKQTGAKTKLDQMHDIVQQYRRKHNQLPSSLEVLTEPDPRNNNEPWCNLEDIRDTWGYPMEIVIGDRAGQFEIVSYGANGEPDGFEADLGWERDLSSVRPLFEVDDSRR